MKPDWDKLIEQFKDSATTLIADVDCTAGGESLCSEIGVQGYPTIKYGDPSDLQDYEGGRDFDELKKFAEGLGPQCSPANLDLCDEAKKAQIDEFSALGASKREEKIKEEEGKITKYNEDFEKFVEGLQKQYEEATKKKDADIAAVKGAGLGLLKAVHNHAKKTDKAEL